MLIRYIACPYTTSISLSMWSSSLSRSLSSDTNEDPLSSLSSVSSRLSSPCFWLVGTDSSLVELTGVGLSPPSLSLGCSAASLLFTLCPASFVVSVFFCLCFPSFKILCKSDLMYFYVKVYVLVRPLTCFSLLHFALRFWNQVFTCNDSISMYSYKLQVPIRSMVHAVQSPTAESRVRHMSP